MPVADTTWNFEDKKKTRSKDAFQKGKSITRITNKYR